MSASEATKQPAPYKVLVVEDDPLVARALARTLMRRGLSVDVVASCAGARKLDGHYDLGIFDIELPDGFGTNLARELVLRATIRGVVFYTGASYQPLLRRAWELGEVVAKESGITVLLDAVELQLNRPRRRFDSGVLHEGDVIGFDWRVDLGEAWRLLGDGVGVQGNLDPVVLFSTPKVIEERVERVLASAGGRPGHIFNLGHGILPTTPVENAAVLIDAVHRLSAR